MEKRWKIKAQGNPERVKELSGVLNISETLANLLVIRGIENYDQAKAYFRPDGGLLHNPFEMLGMQQAVNLLDHHIKSGNRILIYGDYDVDGTSAVALVYSHLLLYHSNLEYYIPDRYKEGYGVSTASIEYAKSQDVKLIIALDCGIKAFEQFEMTSEANIDVIVCDHHKPADQLPKATILNPKQDECKYPYKELTGCGIGFKLMQAFSEHQGNEFEAVADLLDLVALSIGADIVPINGENRTLCALGLERVKRNPRPGIKAILEPANKLNSCTVSDLVFTVAPRINAAGRIKSGRFAVALLIEKDAYEASRLSESINTLNTERRDIEKTITEQAIGSVDETYGHSTVVYHPDWHKGVIGIVASRLIEQRYRPTVVLTKSENVLAGSVRSVKGFDVYEALESCSDLLIQFGGHKYAAGLTMHEENLEAFKQSFEKAVALSISEDLLVPEIAIDCVIDFDQIQDGTNEVVPKFYRILEQFAPFGPGNMKPVFLTKNVRASYMKVLKGSHLSFTAFQEETEKYRSIAFGMADIDRFENQKLDVVYTLEMNEWNGMRNLQLMVKDIRVSDTD